MPKIMLSYRPNGRRQLGRLLKRLLDEAETDLSRPKLWRMVMVMMMLMMMMVVVVVEVVTTMTTTAEAECFPETTVPTDLAAWNSNSLVSLISHKYGQLLWNVTLLVLFSWRQIIVFLDNAARIINLLLQYVTIFNSSCLYFTQIQPNIKCLSLMFHILEAVGLNFVLVTAYYEIHLDFI